MPNKKFNFHEGEVLLIDKPLNWTSFQVVNKIKYRLPKVPKRPKIGHAGTLDPLATGLLILCTGKMTKQIDLYQAQEKEYTGEITLGLTTPSLDLETEFNGSFPIDHITEELIHETTKQFIGEIDQVPPIFSALKVDGKRMYDLARKGKEVEIESRKITISEFEITNIDLPKIEFRVVCSKGTYIRSLARDFGEALQSGSHLSGLRRTRIGKFKITDAYALEDFIQLTEEEE